MAAEDFKLITEEIGPVAAVALLIGTAVGMSIFIVPTQMAAIAGPSVTVAILISVLPMVLGVLLLLQLGGAIPVAGGIYVYGSRLVGPYWGMISIVVPVVAVWSYLLFAALGFAQYLRSSPVPSRSASPFRRCSRRGFSSDRSARSTTSA